MGRDKIGGDQSLTQPSHRHGELTAAIRDHWGDCFKKTLPPDAAFFARLALALEDWELKGYVESKTDFRSVAQAAMLITRDAPTLIVELERQIASWKSKGIGTSEPEHLLKSALQLEEAAKPFIRFARVQGQRNPEYWREAAKTLQKVITPLTPAESRAKRMLFIAEILSIIGPYRDVQAVESAVRKKSGTVTGKSGVAQQRDRMDNEGI